MTKPRVVVIGAGIVGCAIADELTSRGWTGVTVIEQGPLFATGGSTSHAPGLVFQTSPSKTMTGFAAYTVRKYASLELGGRWCFRRVGGLEVAASPERWQEVRRRHGLATSWGVESYLRDPGECAALHPLVDPSKICGGFHIPGDGLASPVRAAEAQGRRAIERGARFLASRAVTGIVERGGAVAGVRTGEDTIDADVVICAAGFWGPGIGTMAGLTIPLVPMAHQYARTGPLAALSGRSDEHAEATAPILRHQDRDLYYREHVDRMGIGFYGHRPMPLHAGEIPGHAEAPVMPSVLPFTEEDFAAAWAASVDLLPALGETKVEEGLNGIFSFTPDGFPLIGKHRGLRGFWVAEAVWITHSAGVARAVAEWLVEGQPAADVHECDLYRFEDAALAPGYIRERSVRSFVEVYDIIHPLQPAERCRPLRVSPFYQRQRELGAVFLEASGWERPQWYEANACLPEVEGIPGRNAWAARYWSPVAGAEALVTRSRVALYDMSTLKRLEVTGSGALAFLQRLTTGNLARPAGSVTYTLMLDDTGGIRSDLTVARLAADRFQVGASSPLDLDWLLRQLPADGSVAVRDITAGTCCVGVWGPLARDLVQPLTGADFSHRGFGYFRAASAYIGEVPVTAMRLSYVGELGWELYTTADLGQRLWDTLWEAGQPLGIIAAGRSAFNSLRLEKGYRSAGVDMTSEHHPYEAGLGFAVRLDKGDFVGREALASVAGRAAAGSAAAAGGGAARARRLVPLVVDDPQAVVMGKEPVWSGGAAAGYVTSAAYGYTIGKGIAYAWLPASAAVPGTPAQIEYFGEAVPAVVAAEPLFDPDMARIRC